MSEQSERNGADPLFETLFRGSGPVSTTIASIASAAPVPTVGTHSRAGNAMGRTRAALLSGAARAVLSDGTKITMSQVATAAGVAKATLYNHFRTREAVLGVLLEHEVGELIARVEAAPLEQALIEAAVEISNHPLVRALSGREPATLARLARVDLKAPAWRTASAALDGALQRAGRGAPGVVLRWLASYLVTPADRDSITEDAQIVLAGLPVHTAIATPSVSMIGTAAPRSA